MSVSLPKSAVLLAQAVAVFLVPGINAQDPTVKWFTQAGSSHADALTAMYAQGLKPALKSQFDQVLASPKGVDGLMVGAKADTTFPYFWNPEAGAFQYYKLQGTTGSWTVNSTVTADLAMLQDVAAGSSGFVAQPLPPAVQCGANGVPLNVLDFYGEGLKFTDSLADTCLCNSQYSGPTCSDFTTASSCPSSQVSQNVTNTGQQVIRGGTNGGSINPVAEAVEFIIDSPQVATRHYKKFEWGACVNSDADTNQALTKYEHATVQNSCNDTFSFGYRVADLVSKCNLEAGNFDYNNGNPVASDAFIRYRGDHHIYYDENVNISLGNGASTSLTRTGRLVTPIDVYIKRLYSANLTNNANVSTTIDVFSPFELKAAVTSTTVKANATTALVSVTFGINSPYEISCISTRQQSGTGAGYTAGLAVTPNDISAYALNAANNALVQEQVCQQDNAGLSNCTQYDNNKICWKTVNFIILTNGVCSLNHAFTIDQITVGCNPQFAGADCPLQTPDTSSALQFTVKAENYCDGQRAMVINDAIVIKSYVPQKDRSRTDETPLRSFVINSDAYLTLFIDSAKSLKVFSMTVLDDVAGGFQTKLVGPNSQYTIPNAATQYIANVNNNLNGDGFDVATQTHSMKVNLGCEFIQEGALGDATRNCLLQPSLSANNNVELSSKLTFYVDYEAGRRRRRQAQSDRGYASMTADMAIRSEDATAAIPSSASSLHAASVLAAAITLASAVLLA